MGEILRRRATSEQRRSRSRRAAEDAAHRFSDWSRVHLGLTTFLEEAWSFRGLSLPSTGGTGLLHQGERAFLVLVGAHLIEPRPTGGRFVGGIFLAGTDQPTSVDVGSLVITDRRTVLCGAAEQREWLFGNLVAVHHDPDAPWTALSVSDRATNSGFFYGHADVPLVRFRLMLALAVHTGTMPGLRSELETALAEHLGRRPPPP